jgi:hypothetical protein
VEVYRRVEWPSGPVAATAETAAIVSVNYNTAPLIARLVWSIYRALGVRGFGSLVIVDNGSRDESSAILNALADAGLIALIANELNRYHGPALNQAVDHLALVRAEQPVATTAIWVLDSDCVVIRPDSLHACVQIMNESGAALVGQPMHDRWNSGELGLHSLLLDPAQVWRNEIEPFQHHGEPSKMLQQSCLDAGLTAAAFPFTRDGYVVHRGRGTLAAIWATGDEDNHYAEWAATHHDPHWADESDAEAIYRDFEASFLAAVPTLTAVALVAACQSAAAARAQDT